MRKFANRFDRSTSVYYHSCKLTIIANEIFVNGFTACPAAFRSNFSTILKLRCTNKTAKNRLIVSFNLRGNRVRYSGKFIKARFSHSKFSASKPLKRGTASIAKDEQAKLEHLCYVKCFYLLLSSKYYLTDSVKSPGLLALGRTR